MNPAALVIHYHRFDHDYAGVGLWIWAPGATRMQGGRELEPDFWDSFGPVFRVQLEEYFGAGEEPAIGFVPRLRHDWSQKDGDDRVWHPDQGPEIWLLGGERPVYTKAPDISPRVQTAYLDGERTLTLRLSHSMELQRINPRSFLVQPQDGEPLGLSRIVPLDSDDGRAKMFELQLAESLDWAIPAQVAAVGYRAAPLQLRGLLNSRKHFGATCPLGATYEPERTVFRAFAPEAHTIDVLLFDSPEDRDPVAVHPMKWKDRGLWEATVKGDLAGRLYRLKVCNADYPGGLMILDPYSRMNTGHDGHCLLGDVRAQDPPAFRPVRRPPFSGRPSDAIIWEMHVRDFSMAESSGVPAGQRGRFLGAAQRGTRIPGTQTATCLDHLVELGVTHVQLLPVMDFDNVESSDEYSWGFMPVNFFSPEGWFASNPRNESRVRELKQMIKAFHDAGIRVILDSVFNHTAPTASFEILAPRYYHRRRNDGTFFNGSLCGNEWRSESPMGQRMILDACRYWVEEYGVDGFCFDLMGLVDMQTLLEVQAILRDLDPTLLIYGEPWTASPPEEAGIRRPTSRFMVAGTGIGAFNQSFREALKGTPNDATIGFVQNGSNREAVKRGLQGAIWEWAWNPRDTVQYISTHAELSLWDKLQKSMPDAAEEERLAAQMLAIGILMVSQGAVFLHAGVEMARTKHGLANTYNAPDEVNQMDWERKRLYPQLVGFTRGMIALRRTHPVFRLAERHEVEERLQFKDALCPGGRGIAFSIFGGGLAGESWREVLVLLNPEPRSLDFSLPPGRWDLYVQAERVARADPLGTAEKSLTVAARSMAVLAVPEE